MPRGRATRVVRGLVRTSSPRRATPGLGPSSVAVRRTAAGPSSDKPDVFFFLNNVEEKLVKIHRTKSLRSCEVRTASSGRLSQCWWMCGRSSKRCIWVVMMRRCGVSHFRYVFFWFECLWVLFSGAGDVWGWTRCPASYRFLAWHVCGSRSWRVTCFNTVGNHGQIILQTGEKQTYPEP